MDRLFAVQEIFRQVFDDTGLNVTAADQPRRHCGMGFRGAGEADSIARRGVRRPIHRGRGRLGSQPWAIFLPRSRPTKTRTHEARRRRERIGRSPAGRRLCGRACFRSEAHRSVASRGVVGAARRDHCTPYCFTFDRRGRGRCDGHAGKGRQRAGTIRPCQNPRLSRRGGAGDRRISVGASGRFCSRRGNAAASRTIVGAERIVLPRRSRICGWRCSCIRPTVSS